MKTNCTIKLEIDAEIIIENLQLKGFCDCHLMTPSEIKTALNQWLQYLISDIHADPDWFIRNNNFTKFQQLLPEPYTQDEFLEESDKAA